MDEKGDQTARPNVAAQSEKTGSGKFEARRLELANAALKTLGQVGYSGASLREIAQKTDFSHGVFHYYFKNRNDLISCAVRQYKTLCATRYDEIVAIARTQEELVAGFSSKLLQTLREDHEAHRLWYDLRAQSLFSSDLRSEVVEIDKLLEAMVWRVVEKYFLLADQSPSASPQHAYALFDGMFQRLLLNWLDTGRPSSQQWIEPIVSDSLRRLA